MPSPVGEGGPRRGSPKTRDELLGVHGKRWMRRTPVSYLNCLLWRRERRGSPPSQRWGGASRPHPTRQKPQKSPENISGGMAGFGVDRGATGVPRKRGTSFWGFTGGEPQMRRRRRIIRREEGVPRRELESVGGSRSDTGFYSLFFLHCCC